YSYDGMTSTAKVTVKDKLGNNPLTPKNNMIEPTGHTSNKTNKKDLPKTGESNSFFYTIVGVVLLGLVTFALIIKKMIKKEK
ncbi:LPXTG cell wall anchor domain-containing protein, partial [Lactococcus sp. S64]|uniref:LPXTG cell wall anchor domain-containing protein n=1 Tax=Lactococcus sp. S64 TaxID=2767459 RepID=UPI00190698A5